MAIFNFDLARQDRANIEADLYKKKKAADVEAEQLARQQIFQEITQRIAETDPSMSPEQVSKAAADIAIGDRAAIAAEAKKRVAVAKGEIPSAEELGKEKTAAEIAQQKESGAKAKYGLTFTTARQPAIAAERLNAEDFAGAMTASNVAEREGALAPGVADAAKINQQFTTATAQGNLAALPEMFQSQKVARQLEDIENKFKMRETQLLEPSITAGNIMEKGLIERAIGRDIINNPEAINKLRQFRSPTTMEALLGGQTTAAPVPGFVPSQPGNRIPIKRTKQPLTAIER